MDRSFLTKFAWLSIAAAIITLGLKTAAYLVSGSVGLLSDAVESIVNLVGALVALTMLSIASRPADDEHPYGHFKAEYFSSLIEGTLIGAASFSIAWTAIERLMNPVALEDLGLGLLVSTAASLVNLAVSLVLSRAGKKHNSIALIASSKHLMTDVWTSGAVLIGIGAVAVTHYAPLDSFVAIAVALNILVSAYSIVSKSVRGLMDGSAPAEIIEKINATVNRHAVHGTSFHGIRTRESGATVYVSLTMSFPGSMSISDAHALTDAFEADLEKSLPGAVVFTHLEGKEETEAKA
jgi:cation diffusion facilitator family transporter